MAVVNKERERVATRLFARTQKYLAERELLRITEGAERERFMRFLII
ncbi:hypothetical protein KP509_13G037900 [Ceratopteris richardii]|uniref:Uncharacterized protein n=1 Tax=Ceratopteris richardii TaxID=49495 RepID=A0A8T2TF22_CERRI|nr:hypothetical protein KP509_13G037900 [Ceratopteris richardii]